MEQLQVNRRPCDFMHRTIHYVELRLQNTVYAVIEKTCPFPSLIAHENGGKSHTTYKKRLARSHLLFLHKTPDQMPIISRQENAQWLIPSPSSPPA